MSGEKVKEYKPFVFKHKLVYVMIKEDIREAYLSTYELQLPTMQESIVDTYHVHAPTAFKEACDLVQSELENEMLDDQRCLMIPKPQHRKGTYDFQMYQYGQKCMRCDQLDRACADYISVGSMKGTKVDVYV